MHVPFQFATVSLKTEVVRPYLDASLSSFCVTSYTAQVLALCAAPFLLDHPQVETIFPSDAVARARRLLGSFKGGMGAYTDSRGNPMVREEVAKFIERRDNVPSNPDVSINVHSKHCVSCTSRVTHTTQRSFTSHRVYSCIMTVKGPSHPSDCLYLVLLAC